MTEAQKNLVAIAVIALLALWFGVLHRPGTYKGVSAEWCANKGGAYRAAYSIGAFDYESVCVVGWF